MDSPDPTAEHSGGDTCPQCGHEVGNAWLVCAWCGKQLAAAAELEEGSRLADGRYQILRVIGRGGFGITYDVGDRRLQRRVAMKELFPESAVRHGSTVLTPPQGRAGFHAARERFMREARVLARFTHPGIVRVYEVFEEHGTAYLVMELLEGRTLIQLLQERNRPFPETEVLDVAGRVAAALRPVHAAGVLHRDINPSNVMMTHHGRIVVIDFGLARAYDEGETQGMTRVVTPGYAPLEQYRGEGRFGPFTDVYGLAATCYRLATGKVPVSALERDAGAILPPPHKLNPAISKSVSDGILDGLELEPTHRPQDLDSFLSRLGIRRLPDSPRSLLLDTVPPPTPTPPLSATTVASLELPEPATGATEVVRRPVGAGTAPAFATTALAAGFGGRDATRPAEAGTDATARPAGGQPPEQDVTRGPVYPRTAVARSLPTALAPPPPPPHLSRAPHYVDAGVPAGPNPRLALAVGPHRPGRRKLLLPLTIVALAAATAAPVLVSLVLVLLVFPALATFGDSVAHRLRWEHGMPGGWAERRLAPGALAPARLVRNVILSVLRSSLALVLGAVLVGGWYGLDRVTNSAPVLDFSLRAVGLVVVGLLLSFGRTGSPRFRSALGLDELVARWVPDGRTTERLVVLWVICVFLVAASLWLTPAPFPLP